MLNTKIPPYTLRYSEKAKHLQIRISKRGLEVVVPSKRRLSANFITQFIEQKQPWIIKNLPAIEQVTALAAPEITLPEQIDLIAINQRWQVSYIPTQQTRLTLFANPSFQISLMGNINDKDLCLEKLRHWLKKMAEKYLFSELYALSKQTGLTFNQVTIRNNLTRWGSCSSQQDINLCCKLLFIPTELMQHVLLHELCHTKVMNHGKAFWTLLKRLDPQAELNSTLLRKAGLQIPTWINK